jgi:hypothetical protein
VTKQKHTPEAIRMLADLDVDLAAAGEATGDRLEWTTEELVAREALADTIARRARVAEIWATATDPKLVVKLSVELRQLDAAVMRLLKEINAEAPPPESLTTVKARNAVNVRWARERERNAGNA